MNREEFLNSINDYLESVGFIKNDNIYLKETQARTAGQVMVINGRRMEQPGQIINIKMTIEECGEGFVGEESFELIGLKVAQNNEIIAEYNISFYYDEFETFKEYCKKLFNT